LIFNFILFSFQMSPMFLFARIELFHIGKQFMILDTMQKPTVKYILYF
jgi:hypothetical protein